MGQSIGAIGVLDAAIPRANYLVLPNPPLLTFLGDSGWFGSLEGVSPQYTVHV
jgi:hypothetical protein